MAGHGPRRWAFCPYHPPGGGSTGTMGRLHDPSLRSGHRSVGKRRQAAGTSLRQGQIGVGHPGRKEEVHGHVLKAPGREEEQTIRASIDKAIDHMPAIVEGKFFDVMNALHRRTRRAETPEQEGNVTDAE